MDGGDESYNVDNGRGCNGWVRGGDNTTGGYIKCYGQCVTWDTLCGDTAKRYIDGVYGVGYGRYVTLDALHGVGYMK